jgi:hypothetical protein
MRGAASDSTFVSQRGWESIGILGSGGECGESGIAARCQSPQPHMGSTLFVSKLKRLLERNGV